MTGLTVTLTRRTCPFCSSGPSFSVPVGAITKLRSRSNLLETCWQRILLTSRVGCSAEARRGASPRFAANEQMFEPCSLTCKLEAFIADYPDHSHGHPSAQAGHTTVSDTGRPVSWPCPSLSDRIRKLVSPIFIFTVWMRKLRWP